MVLTTSRTPNRLYRKKRKRNRDSRRRAIRIGSRTSGSNTRKSAQSASRIAIRARVAAVEVVQLDEPHAIYKGSSILHTGIFKRKIAPLSWASFLYSELILPTSGSVALLRGSSRADNMAPKIVNQQAVNVATLAQRLVSQYFSHVAAMHVARDPRAETLRPQTEPGQHVSVLKIPREDGNNMVMWFDHFLAEGRKPETSEAFDRVWLTGALLTVGDALGANRLYFGHEPEAEIIRHLRNGIAHGNRFKFDDRVIDKTTGRLKHPANISRYAAQQAMPVRQVDTNLKDTEVLFSWGGPDAIVDCLTVLGIHLWRVGHGIPTP
jgi:hypothetical protein